MRPIDMIVVHCAATKPGMDIGAEEIDQWHRRRGWSGIGYHKVIRLDGSIELGRDPDQDGDVEEHVGAHARGYNRRSLGIVYVGGVDAENRPKDTRTEAQKLVLLNEVAAWVRTFHVPIENVLGHYELDGGKACPSFNMDLFRRQLSAFLSAAEQGQSPPKEDLINALRCDLPTLREPLPHTLSGYLIQHATAGDVAAFQRARGLEDDGIVGPQTWGQIIEAVIAGAGQSCGDEEGL